MEQTNNNFVNEVIKNHTHDGVLSQRVQTQNLFGLFETVTTAPTGYPVGGGPWAQVKIHYNSVGPVWKLYIYDTLNNVWKSVTLS